MRLMDLLSLVLRPIRSVSKIAMACTLFASGINVFAGNIIPELQRNRKSINSSSLGLIHQERKVIGTDIGYSETNYSEISSDQDRTTTARGILFHSTESFKAEGTYTNQSANYTMTNSTDEEREIDTMDLKAGYRILENLGVGAGFSRNGDKIDIGELTQNIEEEAIEFGTSYSFKNDFVIGAGIRRNNDTVYRERIIQSDIEYDSYFVGLGQIKLKPGSDGYAWEISYLTREEATTEARGFYDETSLPSTLIWGVGELTQYQAAGILALGRNQFELDFSFLKENDESRNFDLKAYSTNFAYEYLFSNSLYSVTELGFVRNIRGGNFGRTRETVSGTLGGGYRVAKFDIDLRVNYQKANIDSEILSDEEILSYSGNFSYFF